MNQLQMLKMALIAYVNSAKAVWSIVAHPLEIFSKKGKKLKDYRIFGNSVQDGVPTPEAPIEVQSVGELTTKNLFDKDNLVVNRTWNVSNYSSTDTGVMITIRDKGGFCNLDIGLAKDYVGKALCFSWKPDDYNTSTSTRIIIADSSNSVVAESSAIVILEDGTRYTTLTVNGEYTTEILRLRLYFSNIDTSVYNTLKFENIMLCESSEYVPYEPYQKYRVPVTLKGKNLYKPTRLSASGIDKPSTSVKLSNNYGTTISTTDATKGEFTVIQSTVSRPESPEHYSNGFFCFEIGQKVLTVNKEYILSFDCEVLDSLLDTDMISVIPNGTYPMPYFEAVNGRASVRFKYVLHGSGGFDNYLEIRNAGKSLKISNIMITEVESDQDYEPYIEPQTHNLYLDAPLRKIENYVDFIDFEKGVVVRRIGEKVFDGSERWVLERLDSGTNCYTYIFNANNQNLKVYSNKGKYYQSGSLYYDYAVRISQASLNLNYRYPNLSDIGSFKQVLEDWYKEGNPFYINYILDDAYITEEKVTLPALPTFKGTTIYEVQTSTEPSGMQACYYE